MKAYKIVENIFNFRNRKKKCAYDVVYNSKETDISEDKAVLLHSLNGKSIKEFNKWFNEQFEKTKVNDDENDSGYGKWIKENEVSENNEKVSLSEFGRVFEKKKTECKALVKYNGVQDTEGGNDGYNLVRDKVENYSSGLILKKHIQKLLYLLQEKTMRKRKNFPVSKCTNDTGILKTRRHHPCNSHDNI